MIPLRTDVSAARPPKTRVGSGTRVGVLNFADNGPLAVDLQQVDEVGLGSKKVSQVCQSHHEPDPSTISGNTNATGIIPRPSYPTRLRRPGRRWIFGGPRSGVAVHFFHFGRGNRPTAARVLKKRERIDFSCSNCPLLADYWLSVRAASRPEEVSQPKSRFLRSGEPRFLKAFK
ncbi:Uncharacterised protein [Pseudomonas fragi]|uniref:Uncharacterized protein n=1 Tax=Pseudomonas fragi TaxID=296 RepID=A0A449IS78_PSEFR|nr:Uncharacterised protein [Pseudomonas fragi]